MNTTKFAIIAGTAVLFAENSAPHQKVLTPEQKEYQAEFAQWQAQRKELNIKAKSVLGDEMAREKAGDCPNASSTREELECLSTEMAKTQSNYETFAGAIRGMLAMSVPMMPGQKPASGPTGMERTATELVEEFDQLEAEAKKYRTEAGTVAFNQYKGGTLAPVFEGQATQRLVRLHMQEIAFIYGEKVSNH